MFTTTQPAPVSYRQLTWTSADRSFTGEISALNGFGRVWADSCDEGFTIIGQTGRPMVFAVSDVKYDAEGDLLYWDLRPITAQDRAIVSGARIFND
jgi:hypothetical protein